MTTRAYRAAWLLALCLLGSLATPAQAQEEELTFSVRRTFGYGGGSQIQGSFRMEVTSPADLVSVTFRIDETVVGTVTQAPFRVNFETDDYPPGWHALTAAAQTRDGRTLTSPVRRFEFLSAAQAWQAGQGLLIPMVSVVGVVLLIAMGVPFILTFTGRRSRLPLGAPRSYGLLGGTICPKCERPFGLHWWAFNVSLVGKFDRCDHCGKWSLVRRESAERLAEAEAAELLDAQGAAPAVREDGEATLRRQLEETRYTE
jgi:hypothetical protein